MNQTRCFSINIPPSHRKTSDLNFLEHVTLLHTAATQTTKLDLATILQVFLGMQFKPEEIWHVLDQNTCGINNNKTHGNIKAGNNKERRVDIRERENCNKLISWQWRVGSFTVHITSVESTLISQMDFPAQIQFILNKDELFSFASMTCSLDL